MLGASQHRAFGRTIDFLHRSSTILIGRRSASVITSTAQPSQAVSQRFGLVLLSRDRVDMTSEASGLAPDARIKGGTYFFFFFAAFFVAKTLTPLRNPMIS